MTKSKVLALLMAGAGLAVATGAHAQEWNRHYEYFKDRPHPPHCEYRIAAHGGAPIALFGNPREEAQHLRKAEERAIRDWSEEAAHLFGPRFADWGRAEDKSVHCDKRGLNFECNAAANPCREH